MKILITGGAGFVGSRLALAYRREMPKAKIVVFDNLRRRGSETNLGDFKTHGIDFCHGDIRNPSDFAELKDQFDLFIEASAEPSVLAGLDGSPDYLLQTNLIGTMHCLEFARRHCDRMVFLSTSRVYSINPLQQISLEERETRLDVKDGYSGVGVSGEGISENFAVDQHRSLYGASKLCSEYLIQEYCATYSLKAVINRCGVIAGPGQFGKVDQGVFTLWVARHFYGKPLKYTGFGGNGKQVRDLLHPEDLFRLIQLQQSKPQLFAGEVLNVGGGRKTSTSMLELTGHCQEATGKSIEIASDPKTSPVDIPYYVTDHSKASALTGWRPEKSVPEIVGETAQWIQSHEKLLEPIFG